MQPIYSQTFTLTDMDVDRFCKMKLSSLLFYAQEVAGKHSALLGADYEALAKKNLFWAVSRHKVQITRLPTLGETITVETWPMPTTRVAYPRALVAFDAEGKELFRSISLWVLMDLESRAMVLPGKSGVDVPGTLLGCEAAAPGSIHGRTFENYVNRTVGYAVLDKNGHMNNTRWLDWTSNLLSSEFHRNHTLKQLDICYLAEATEGQQLSLFWQLDGENQLQVEALTADESARRILALNAQYEDFVRV